MNLATTILGLDLQWLMQILVMLMMSIIFLQSGIDKVVDRKGNMDFITEKFKDTFLGAAPGFNYLFITLLELASGIVCAIGLISLAFQQNTFFSILGLLLSALSIISILFGQRISKDYDGAAVMMGYFLVAMFGLFLFL